MLLLSVVREMVVIYTVVEVGLNYLETTHNVSKDVRRSVRVFIYSSYCVKFFIYRFQPDTPEMLYSCLFNISICSLTALLLVPPVAFFSSTARS